jgi:hypothetical protein
MRDPGEGIGLDLSLTATGVAVIDSVCAVHYIRNTNK